MDNELLLFEIRSIADQAEQGFIKAAKSAQELGTAYEDLMKKEDKTEDQLASLSQKAKEHSAQMARAKLEEAKAIMQATEARIRDLKIVREDFREAQKYWTEEKKSGQDRARAGIELHKVNQELARIEKELNDARKDGKKSLDDYNKAINNAVKAEEQLAKSKQEVTQATDTTTDSSIALIASIGALVGMYTGLKRILGEVIQAYNDNRAAMVGLRSIVENTGGSFGSAQKAIEEFVQDGLVPIADASTALKNLLARGFGMEEAIDIMNRFKDSAAFGRQSSLELGEAVRTATEGIKNENSILVDNAGVTKNVSVMWKEYADSIGVGVQSLTLAQKREAEYQGIMRETQHQVGDALKLSQEFAGSQAALTAQTTQLKVALGEAATAGVAPFNKGLTGILKNATEFVKESSPFVAFLIQGTKAFLAASAAALAFNFVLKKNKAEMLSQIPIVGKLASGIGTLAASMLKSPVGIITTGIAVLVGVLAGLDAQAEKTRQEFEALNDEAKQLGEEVGGATRLVERFEELQNKAKLTKEETAEMNQISVDLVENYGFRADAVNKEGQGIANNLELMKEQLEIERESLRLKLQKIEETNTETYKEAQQNLADAKAKQAELEASTESLAKAYEDAKNELKEFSDLQVKFAVERDPTGQFDPLDLNPLINAVHKAENAKEKNAKELEQAAADIARYTDAVNTQIENSINLAILTAQVEGKKIPLTLHNVIRDGMRELAENDPEGELSSKTATEYIDRYFDISSASGVADSAIAEVQRMKEEFITALTSDESISVASAGQLVKDVFGDLVDSKTLQEAFEKGQELRNKIEEGKATPDDKKAYNKIRNDLRKEIAELVKVVRKEGKKLNIPTSGLVDSLNKISSSFAETAESIEEDSLKEALEEMGLEGFTSKMDSAANSANNLRQEMADWADLQSAIDIVKAGAENSEHYADALEWLADRYGVSKEAVLENIDTYQSDADWTSTLINLKIALAQAQVEAAIGMVNAMASMSSTVAANSKSIIDNLQAVMDKLTALNNTKISLEEDKDKKSGLIKVIKGGKNPFTGSGSGWAGYSSQGSRGGSSGATARYTNEGLEKELARIDYLKYYNKITIQQEIDLLKKAKTNHAKIASERAEIDRQIYALRQQRMDSDLDYQKSRNQISLKEEVKRLAKKRSMYKKGTEAWKDADKAVYQAQQRLSQSRLDYQRSLNALTLKQEIDAVRRRRDTYKKGTEAWKEANAEVYQLEQNLAQSRLDYQRSINAISLKEEVNLLKKRRDNYKKGTEAWKEANAELYQAQKALEQSRLDYQRSINAISLQEEVNLLKKKRDGYKKGTEAWKDANAEFYQAQKTLEQSRLDYLRSMNKLTIAEEIKLVKAKRDGYKKGTEAWKDANAELYQLQVQQRRAIYDNDVYYDRLSLEQQREWLKKEIQLHKAGTEARIALEKELHDTLKQIRERDVETINTLTGAIQAAIKERYKVQQQAEVDRINQSIKNWQDWATNQKNAIQKQIDALDDLSKAEDRADEEQKKQRDIDALRQKIMYEHDMYNREQLQRELAEKEKEYSKWKRDNERADLKEALQEQSKLVDEVANAQKDKLSEQLENTNKYYEQLTKSSAINAETEKILMNNSQQGIINLLKTYVPEYDTIGQSMGEKLVEGFTKKVGNIDTWFTNFNKKVSAYQGAMAIIANSASDRYWQNRIVENPRQVASGAAGSSQAAPAIHVYFNQPIESPSQVTRELERLSGRLGRMN